MRCSAVDDGSETLPYHARPNSGSSAFRRNRPFGMTVSMWHRNMSWVESVRCSSASANVVRLRFWLTCMHTSIATTRTYSDFPDSPFRSETCRVARVELTPHLHGKHTHTLIGWFSVDFIKFRQAAARAYAQRHLNQHKRLIAWRPLKLII